MNQAEQDSLLCRAESGEPSTLKSSDSCALGHNSPYAVSSMCSRFLLVHCGLDTTLVDVKGESDFVAPLIFQPTRNGWRISPQFAAPLPFFPLHVFVAEMVKQ